MGADQSKAQLVNEKKVVQQLQSMRIRESSVDDDDFVQICNEKPRPRVPVEKGLDTSTLAEWEHDMFQDPKNRLALSALSSAKPASVLASRSTRIRDQQVFNIKIDFEGSPITDQKNSGRCWLFAATNVFRVALMKKHNLDKFQLSQAYLFFWDKLEKANYFLSQILDTADEDFDSRLVQRLFENPVNDGGQWDMVINIVNKYGLVPQSLYPDSFNAMDSSSINTIITTKLREDGLLLRSMAGSASSTTITKTKEHMMREVHRILTLTLGPPPSPTTEFTWDFNDASGNGKTIKKTPIAFAKELSEPITVRLLSYDVNTMFSLVNDPRNEYYRQLTVDRLGNVYGPDARSLIYVNVPMDIIKTACIKMLRANQPIFFGSDVGQFSEMSGVMDLDLIDYELGFNIKLGMTKAQRLLTGESLMTHAMVLTAVHVEKDAEGHEKAIRWRVQNSWGETAGDHGWFVMSDTWMDEFVYQAVVEPRFVAKEVRDVLKQKPKVLPLWDPIGALA